MRKQLVPIALAALCAIALAASSAFVGETRRPSAIARAQGPRDAAVVTPNIPPSDESYVCRQPSLEIPKTRPCDRGRGYPQCRWQVPSLRGPDRLYSIWRNTTPEHRWARPGLVSLILASASDYARRWPGERLTIGDLDAPGPRHATHDRGVDVDLYLTHAMMTRSEGGRRYVDNYAERNATDVASLRARVLDLARILATCANGQVRIYYNDPEIVSSFRTWFDARGFRSEVGLPMQPHNELHEFHFHLTIPEELAPLPIDR